MLQMHIQETLAMASTILKDPRAAAQAKMLMDMQGAAQAGGPAEGMPMPQGAPAPQVGTGAGGQPGMVRGGHT